MTEQIDFEAGVPQDPFKPNVLPGDISGVGRSMFAGAEVDIFKESNELRTLYSQIREYRKMEADPTVSGTLQAFTNILGMVQWKVNAAPKPEDTKKTYSRDIALEQKVFLEENIADNAQSLRDIADAAFDMLSIGFMVQVPQFKIRRGKNSDPLFNSKYDDGRIGWKSFKIINQDTVDSWITPNGEGYTELTGIQQSSFSGRKEVIPRNRMLLFRTTSKGDSPSGESILFGAHSTWKSKERILKIEEVSLERNLEGVPVARVPGQYLSNSATPDEKALVTYVTKIVQHLKYNQQTGLVLPSDTDDRGNRLVDIDLMTCGSNSRLDASRKVILDKEKLISESLLSGFIKLGGSQGSNALSEDMSSMFIVAMKTYLNEIKEQLNKEAIPTLFQINGMDMEHLPTLDFVGLEKDTVTQFVDNLTKAISTGGVIPTARTQKSLLEKMNVTTEGADEEWQKAEDQLEASLNQPEPTNLESAPVSIEKSTEGPEDNEYALSGDQLYKFYDGQWNFVCEAAIVDQNGNIYKNVDGNLEIVYDNTSEDTETEEA